MSETTGRLHALQDMLINEFIERIESGQATPSDLNAARQLLKDNGIHAHLQPNNPLANLVARLPFDDESDTIVRRAVEVIDGKELS